MVYGLLSSTHYAELCAACALYLELVGEGCVYSRCTVCVGSVLPLLVSRRDAVVTTLAARLGAELYPHWHEPWSW